MAMCCAALHLVSWPRVLNTTSGCLGDKAWPYQLACHSWHFANTRSAKNMTLKMAFPQLRNAPLRLHLWPKHTSRFLSAAVASRMNSLPWPGLQDLMQMLNCYILLDDLDALLRLLWRNASVTQRGRSKVEKSFFVSHYLTLFVFSLQLSGTYALEETEDGPSKQASAAPVHAQNNFWSLELATWIDARWCKQALVSLALWKLIWTGGASESAWICCSLV